MVPINIPSESNIVDEMNGYVANYPLVKTFLLAASFIISLFSINGNVDKNISSSLKLALLVCIPLLCVIPSILFR